MIADNKPKRTRRTLRAAAGVTAAAVFIIAGGAFGAAAANADEPVADPTTTDTPTDTPTDQPTDTPSDTPSDTPTDQPTDTPTQDPTDPPTSDPTDPPTSDPTDPPQSTDEPTVVPAPDYDNDQGPRLYVPTGQSPEVGFPLSAWAGVWKDDLGPGAYTHTTSWFSVDGSTETPIGDGSDQYIPTAADLGKKIKVVFTATNSVGTGTAFLESDPVVGYTQASDIQILGQPKVGAATTVTVSGWNVTPDSITYQWSTFTGTDAQSAILTPIEGATSASFTPTAAEVGKGLWVDIKGVKSGWLSRPLHLWTSTAVQAADANNGGGGSTEPGDGGNTQPGSGGNTGGGSTQQPGDNAAPPKAPFADDSGFTDANKGNVSGAQDGKWVTIDVPGLPDGYKIYVYGFSTPTGLGWYTVSGGKIKVDVTALPVGNHTLALVAADGTLIGHVPATVTASTGNDSTSVSNDTPTLPFTGSSIEGAIFGGSIAALIALVGVFLVARKPITDWVKARIATASK